MGIVRSWRAVSSPRRMHFTPEPDAFRPLLAGGVEPEPDAQK